jgi:hypothetical protein
MGDEVLAPKIADSKLVAARKGVVCRQCSDQPIAAQQLASDIAVFDRRPQESDVYVTGQ